jgi:hypothetical protein
MAPTSSVVEGLETVLVVSPAISPIYDNNPGYGMLKVSDGKVKNLTFRFF